MRKIIQFQSTTAYVWALTDDGILWQKTHKGDTWTAIKGPGDGNPFKAPLTDEQKARMIKQEANKRFGPNDEGWTP